MPSQVCRASSGLLPFANAFALTLTSFDHVLIPDLLTLCHTCCPLLQLQISIIFVSSSQCSLFGATTNCENYNFKGNADGLEQERGQVLQPFQSLEYQMVRWVCRFDTLGKLVSAHRAGVLTTPGHCGYHRYCNQGLSQQCTLGAL